MERTAYPAVIDLRLCLPYTCALLQWTEASNGWNEMSDVHHFGWQGRSLSMGRFTVSARGMRIAFMAGAAFVSVGVALQVVDIVNSRSTGYRLAGMGMSTEMIIGMSFIGVGIAMALLALLRQPRGRQVDIHLV